MPSWNDLFSFAAVDICARQEPGEDTISSKIDAAAGVSLPDRLKYSDSYYAPGEENDFEIAVADGDPTLSSRFLPSSTTILFETSSSNDHIHIHMQLLDNCLEEGLDVFEEAQDEMGDIELSHMNIWYSSDVPPVDLPMPQFEAELFQSFDIAGTEYAIEDEGHERFGVYEEAAGSQLYYHSHIGEEGLSRSEIERTIAEKRSEIEDIMEVGSDVNS